MTLITPDRTSLIVALGDSTTAGTPGFKSPIEAPPDGSGDVTSQYPWWLAQATGWQVLNRGVNGERSDQIRERFARDVAGVAPSVVIIIAGVNDVYQGRPASHVIGELAQMYELAREAGITVVAGSIVPYNTATPEQNLRMREVNDWVAHRAEHLGDILFCDTRAAVAAAGNPDRLAESPDDLHPSPAGYRLMAEALEPVVRAAQARAAASRPPSA